MRRHRPVPQDKASQPHFSGPSTDSCLRGPEDCGPVEGFVTDHRRGAGPRQSTGTSVYDMKSGSEGSARRHQIRRLALKVSEEFSED